MELPSHILSRDISPKAPLCGWWQSFSILPHFLFTRIHVPWMERWAHSGSHDGEKSGRGVWEGWSKWDANPLYHFPPTHPALTPTRAPFLCGLTVTWCGWLALRLIHVKLEPWLRQAYAWSCSLYILNKLWVKYQYFDHNRSHRNIPSVH